MCSTDASVDQSTSPVLAANVFNPAKNAGNNPLNFFS